MTDRKRFRPIDRSSYKKVEVDTKRRKLILEASLRSPEDWGPECLSAYIERHHRIKVTRDEIFTVLNS